MLKLHFFILFQSFIISTFNTATINGLLALIYSMRFERGEIALKGLFPFIKSKKQLLAQL